MVFSYKLVHWLVWAINTKIYFGLKFLESQQCHWFQISFLSSVPLFKANRLLPIFYPLKICPSEGTYMQISILIVCPLVSVAKALNLWVTPVQRSCLPTFGELNKKNHWYLPVSNLGAGLGSPSTGLSKKKNPYYIRIHY